MDHEKGPIHMDHRDEPNHEDHKRESVLLMSEDEGVRVEDTQVLLEDV